MKRRFFSRPVWLFGNVAIMILCAIFFLVPFALRGARMAVQDIRNEVTDWLPKNFPETEVLAWFRPRFVGDQFVAISWDGCSQGEPAYDAFVAKLQSECLENESNLSPEQKAVKRIADKLALQQTDERYHSNWGTKGEKWLMGKKRQWYYVTREGQLFRWKGKNNAFSMAQRGLAQFLHGAFEVRGEPINLQPNLEFYENPKLLCARFFKTIQSGPEILQKLISEDGPLKSLENAELEAHKRLTGTLFGPTPSTGFQWTREAFVAELTKEQFKNLPKGVEEEFELYVKKLLDVPEFDYNGDIENLINAGQEEKLEHWYNFFTSINQKMPPRQTAIVVVLNEPVFGELDRVVGRDILGKPMGRLRYLATNECGITKDELHLGGPPCDNVAIDEEGTITLVRLVGFSSLVGLIIAYASFRSVLVTMMVFFVGGVSAIASLGIVWYADSQLDAILLTMPSLVYVLGLSGAVHIVNYYREACKEDGHRGAAETAVKYGWFPCTLAALTTSLGLISLYVSNLIPIKKFGLFSAIGTMVTVTLLFTYLPASLKLFPPGYTKDRKKKTKKENGTSLYELTNRFWSAIGNWVIKRHALVFGTTILILFVVGLGIFKIKTSVQLIKLFDQQSDVVQDYVWMEENLGKLVPMEIVLGFDRDVLDNDEDLKGRPKPNFRELDLKYSRLDRIEAGAMVREELERAFGEQGQGIIGKGLSTDNFLPVENVPNSRRELINGQLAESRDTLLKLETHTIESDPDSEKNYGYEFWRISLRLGALNDVDYGLFVSDLKRVVEPILSAFEYRTIILKQLTRKFEADKKAAGVELEHDDRVEGSVLLIGYDSGKTPTISEANIKSFLWEKDYFNQTEVFCRSLRTLLSKKGFSSKGKVRRFAAITQDTTITKEALDKALARFDCVVLISDHELFDAAAYEASGNLLIDARSHAFSKDLSNEKIVTMRQRRNQAFADEDQAAVENIDVVATYSGIVPIVYKAQRSLLKSLIDSICLAFGMIALVMMILLRDWKRKASVGNSLNFSGGLVSMLPNVFPVVLIFGLMGHMGRVVDIGSMMTASVAMGVAVDDTIHFLNWFRKGLRDGMSRNDSIRLAYRRCGAAMTQTTLIGGLGLSVFGFSTFTPTQGFGILMLLLLMAALIGDLIFLPAILAGPLGLLFTFKNEESQSKTKDPSAREAKKGSPEIETTGGDGLKESKAKESSIEKEDPPDTNKIVPTKPHSQEARNRRAKKSQK